MRHMLSLRIVTLFLAVVLSTQLGVITAARAAVITTSPSLPLLGVPFASPLGVGCFPGAGVCIESGSLVQTAPVTSSFIPSGQDITTAATYTGILTNLSNLPLGVVTLTGSVRQLIEGRTSDTETGTWSTRLLDLSLTGLVLGATLSVELDDGNLSTGVTSITPLSTSNLYQIDSYFDIFVDLTLDLPTPLNASRGPIRVTAEAVPEPMSAALLGVGMLGLIGVLRRR